MEKIKSYFKDIVFCWHCTQFLIQFWKVIKIGGKRLLTTRHQPFGFSKIDEGLCQYRLISLDYEFDVDRVSDEYLGLHGRVFRHQQWESTPNVQYYSCKEYPQRDRAIVCNIKQSLAVPLFDPLRQRCIGVFEMVSTTDIINVYLGSFLYFEIQGLTRSKCEHLYHEKVKDETPEEIRKMLDVVYSTHYLPLAQTWSLCRLCNAVFRKYRTCHREGRMGDFLAACALQHLRKGQGVVGRAILSQNLVFCKDITQFSITEYPFAHYALKVGLTGSFAIFLRSSYIEDNVYVLEFFLPPNYTEGRDPRIALVPLLTTMKQHCKSFKVASGEELGEELSIEVLDFSEDGKLYCYQIPQTARSPNKMENGEETVFLDLSYQQLPEVDAIDTGNNIVSNTEENNIVFTSSQQKLIINSSQRLQRKARIPISLEKNGKLDSFKKPQIARSPNRMENGEEMVFLDLSDQQLPKVDAIDIGNNFASNTEDNNSVVTSVQQIA
ncbi:protein NLP6-like [Camellia sinensis]|uniref:protein NLP6-like n=1 Tax=Camellia sinensis TaxID=4442 RepID=UPI0010357E59|nr:protein NLP6-like [Camellia sinensis]